MAEKENIDIRFYDVIYNAINDVRLAMAGLLEPILKENIIGHAEVREIFRVPKIGTVAGCHVTDGHVERNAKIRLLRDDVVVLTARFHLSGASRKMSKRFNPDMSAVSVWIISATSNPRTFLKSTS